MKINKCSSLILAILILVSNTGLAFSVHYCGDEVASIKLKTIFSNANSETGCCEEMEMKSHCCHNKVLHFQKKSDNSVLKYYSFTFHYNNKINDWKPIVFQPVVQQLEVKIPSLYCNLHAPPLYKLHHQFIFYG